jgi:hypothetical protein
MEIKIPLNEDDMNGVNLTSKMFGEGEVNKEIFEQNEFVGEVEGGKEQEKEKTPNAPNINTAWHENEIEPIETRGRPKLIKFEIKKNMLRWTIKNTENNAWHYLKIDPLRSEENLHAFLSDVGACHNDLLPKTSHPVDYGIIAKDIWKNGKATVWIQKNKIDVIKSTWYYEPKTETHPE